MLTETDQAGSARERLAASWTAARRLTLFFTTTTDPIWDALCRLLEHAVDPDAGMAAYRNFFRLLADEAEFCRGELIGDAWKNHLLARILADENPFSRKAALAPEISPALRAAAAWDLRCLQTLFQLDSRLFAAALGDPAGFIPWEELRSLPGTSGRRTDAEERLLRAFLSAADWGTLAADLAGYYAQNGCGVFQRYRAFRWVANAAGGALEGIETPDPIRLADLIGYEKERDLLLRNTEHFLAGRQANNVLLYGDRGTGKSSSVKALLNEYAGRGLRLIEVPKHQLGAFPRILKQLRGRPERFILFVDDLSFEEHETTYKDLKAVLEGNLEVRPENVLLYATSNRRHLIPERFSDRDGGSEEIHARDTQEEKLSLSDRFGITITFLAPTQALYLEIVTGLARREGLRLSEAELRRQALQWAARHNGWSGRSARQFLDFALGEQTTNGQ